MESTLSLRIQHEAGPAEAARLADRVAAEINRPGSIRAAAETRPAQPGERALDVPLVGQLALTFLSGGAAAALINTLAAWLPRGGDTKVDLVLADGTSLTLAGRDMTPKKTAEYVEALRKFEPRG
jgi:ferric-dicitrate binding protein FerR (iron transport regulator)